MKVKRVCVCSTARYLKRRKSSRANARSKLLVLGLGDAVLGKVGIDGETRGAFPHSEERSEGRRKMTEKAMPMSAGNRQHV